MDILTRQELRALVESKSEPSVSILMPTRRAGHRVREHRLKLKNLLGEAEQRLRTAGLRRPEIVALLEPARRLLRDGLFWSHQGDGLAVYLASAESHLFRLPLDLPELVAVSDRFHVKPLLPLLSSDGEFYLLAISQKRIRLFQCGRHSVVQVDLPGLESSLVEVLRGADLQTQLQFHTAAPAAGGGRKRPAVYHGHGAGDDDTQARILHYFHRVDDVVSSTLQGEQAPLLVAAVKYLVPIYREANSYPYLVEPAVGGSPDRLSAAALHGRGWDLVAPLFAAGQSEAVRRYSQAESTGLAAGSLEAILPAAHHGQVEVLFVAVAVQQWGWFDPHTNRAYLHHDAEPGDEDLLDLAAVQTFLNGGTVYAVAPEEVPGGGPLAALLRW